MTDLEATETFETRALETTADGVTAAAAADGGTGAPGPADAAPSDPERWRSTGRYLLARLIAELAYEELLTPTPVTAAAAGQPATDGSEGGVGRGPARRYRLSNGRVAYTFTARRGTFGTWWVDAATVRRQAQPGGTAGIPGQQQPDGPGGLPAWDPALFLLDLRDLLGWPGHVLTDVLQDLVNTHQAEMRLARRALPAARLADLTYTALEGHQNGHPCMVANKGRLGFGASDAARYTPEAGRPLRLLWVAAHPDLARYFAIEEPAAESPGQSPGEVPAAGGGRILDIRLTELDASTRAEFTRALHAALRGTGHEAEAARYVWLPVHPWQWEHVVAVLFAGQIAAGLLVRLGVAADRYLPLQAVRTLANVDRPSRHNVKLALMMRNTLIWRGMSMADAEAAPTVSTWLATLARQDEFLRRTGVIPLLEVAGAAVRHPAFDAVADAPYRFHELLGVFWREPVESRLAPGERARTLAALLNVGSDGRALVAELVDRSGMAPREWIAALLRALLPPLLHYFYAYGVVFTPHGENVICVFDADERPTRIALKDFGADVELVEGDYPERAAGDGAPKATALCRRLPAGEAVHSLLSALFAGHFRFFSVVVADHLGLPERQFWSLVRDAVEDYQRRFPQYAHRFAAADLLAPRFGRVCLNREQFSGAGYHDRTGRDAPPDLVHGEVANPLALVGGDGAARPAGTGQAGAGQAGQAGTEGWG